MGQIEFEKICRNESRIMRNEKDIQTLWGEEGVYGLRKIIDNVRSETRQIMGMAIIQLGAVVLTLVGIIFQLLTKGN